MLHLDGWADCCDALFVPLSRERRLEVMKDPRLGSFGGAGLILLLLVKLAAVAEVLAPTTDRPLAGLLPLLVVPVLGRWAVVIAAASFPLARPDGMGASFRRGLGRREVILATLTTAVACLLMGWGGLVLWAAAVLALLGMARLATARLGGLTGDVYGAIVELTETVALVACAVCLRIGIQFVYRPGWASRRCRCWRAVSISSEDAPRQYASRSRGPMFRIGTTSYIIPADILPNVEYLAPQVDDVQLVLFETDAYGSNLPDAALCARLIEIGTRMI